jgi:UDP-N-acetylmuramyl pentapeptide synthase
MAHTFTDIVADSRQVTPGALFIAIPGATEDGAKCIAEARAKVLQPYGAQRPRAINKSNGRVKFLLRYVLNTFSIRVTIYGCVVLQGRMAKQQPPYSFATCSHKGGFARD